MNNKKIYLLLLGLLAYALALPGIKVLGLNLDAHTMLFGTLAILMGYQLIQFAVFSKTFAIEQGLIPVDKVLTRHSRLFTLERSLILGSVMFTAGTILLGLAVKRVRIARPERRNAMTQDMYRGLKKAAVMADGDPEIDALLITGSGEWFCVGGDMSGEAENAEALALEPDPTDHHPFRHMERCRKVVVSAVNGACHAGGVNLLLFSDVTVRGAVATVVERQRR